MADKAEVYLAAQKNSASPVEVAENFQVLENFYVRKYWNQLATETHKLLHDNKFCASVDLKQFYEDFVHEFEHRISPLVLVEIVLPIARYIFAKDRAAAIAFLVKFEKLVAKNKLAAIRLQSGQIELRLQDKDAKGSCIDIAKAREMIESTQKKLDEIAGVTEIHASFYKVSALYLREMGNYAAYYKESLRYLGCEDLAGLSPPEKKSLATLLGVAALLGQDIYNFGELLAHPILKFLEGSDDQWLFNFLVAFNSGDLGKFREFEVKWAQWPDIAKNRDLLEGKIRLLCLMEIALSRPAKERNITFEEISQKAQVEPNKVEFLVMKALSRGLIRGSIDQVRSMVNVNWIQPRVLSLEQISAMADRIDVWRRDVESMEGIVSKNAKEIIMKT